jgi:ABC-2 type transport system permease protein
MREAFAFVRQDYLTQVSYRVRAFFSVLGLIVSLIPLYFVAQALQPVMARSIEAQGREYFAFLLVGIIASRWMVVAVTTLPEALGAAVRTGTLESLFATPVPFGGWVLGMMGYKLVWTTVESGIIVVVGLLLGVRFVGPSIVTAFAVLVLITAAYMAFGIAGGALILFFRTTGPLLSVILLGSTLLGGVYYPTHVIPSWIQRLSAVVPLTYGLRALRKTLLEGVPLEAVRADVTILTLFVVTLLVCSLYSLRCAVRHARHTGSLAQY